MEKVKYAGWNNCYRISNDIIELIITGDVGPRIIRFGFIGQDNEFKEYEDMIGKTGGDDWRIYGGHRLWHSPEAKPRTYFPDNFPVEIQDKNSFVRVIQPIETTTGIEKEIDIEIASNKSQAKITHRLRNKNLWDIELAPWALSVMAQGGRAIVPLPPRGSHEENLLPTNSMTLWAYTDMTDKRWKWGSKYIMLFQDSSANTPQKIGIMVPDSWACYARNNHLFVKRFKFIDGDNYPDFGCSVEIFTNSDMLELETLGPITKLAPGQAVEHIEYWYLFDNVEMPETDDDIDKYILPKIKETQIV